MAGLVVFLIGVGGYLYNLISSPVEGKVVPAQINKSKMKKTTASPEAKPEVALSSDIFDLKVPPGYTVQQSSGQISAGLLYQRSLIKSSAFGSIVIAIAIKPLPEGGLSADSSYTSRQQQPEHYRFSDVEVRGETLKIATEIASGSTVVFWPYGGHLATIGTSSAISNPTSDTTEIMRAIKPLLEAWRWR